MLQPCQEQRLARCNQAPSVSSLSVDHEIDSEDDNGAATASTLTGDLMLHFVYTMYMCILCILCMLCLLCMLCMLCMVTFLSVKVKRKAVEEDKSAAHDADATTTGDCLLLLAMYAMYAMYAMFDVYAMYAMYAFVSSS